MSKEKASKLIQGLEDYLNNTPPEQLEKDFAELEKYNQFGPNIEDCLNLGEAHCKAVMAVMNEEVPILENSNLTEADVRKVIGLFNESSDYFNKKIDDERGENGGSQLAIDLLDGRIDAKELAVQYVLHRLNIKNG